MMKGRFLFIENMGTLASDALLKQENTQKEFFREINTNKIR